MQKQNSHSDPEMEQDLSALRSADISFEDQVQIIGQINEAVEKNRIEIKADTFLYKAKKNGSSIPLLVNAAALLLLVGAALFMLFIFNREERTLIRESATVLSAEGKLIAALRQESEQQLNRKDRQITEIRNRLEELRRQAETARLETEAQIRQREEQLRGELEARVAAERRSLEDQGLSDARIDDRLRELERRLSTENDARLTEFRGLAERQLEEKQAEIENLEQQNRQTLLQFQQERSALQQQFSQREEQLRARLAREVAEARENQQEAADQLTALRDQQRAERLVGNQILSSYNGVEDALAAGRYDTALEDLETLDGYLSQEAITVLPALQDRIPTERFLIASLRDLIELRRLAGTGIAAAEVAGTEEAAATEASEESAAELEQVRATLNRLTRELRQATAALEQRTSELSQARSTIARQNQQLAGYEAESREIAATREELRSLRRRYAALSARDDERVSQAKILSLVDTKLQVREVLSSEAVKSEYPALYDAMEEYFQTYGTVQMQAGRQAALEEAGAVLDQLSSGGSADLPAIKHSYGAAGNDPFASFLQKLAALLE